MTSSVKFKFSPLFGISDGARQTKRSLLGALADSEGQDQSACLSSIIRDMATWILCMKIIKILLINCNLWFLPKRCC